MAKSLGKGLGRGLDALFQDNQGDEVVEQLRLHTIRPNPYQPRQEFEEAALHELAESIKIHGVLQPIVVRKSVKGYDIVVGERRYRASKLAGKQDIPAIVKSMTDKQMMELAIIENLQREDLNPLEEARSYQLMMEHLNLTQSEAADRLGKSRPYIANMLRLLNLPADIKQLINDKKISGGHGRTLLGLKDTETMQTAAAKVITEAMSVRQLELYVKSLSDQPVKDKKEATKPKFLVKHEQSLKERLGTKVEISKSRKKGKIAIEFTSEEEFNRLISLLESAGR
ncbi:ParB/RepB/Spo0J family partition protein [Macrococcus equipercicus]|uniref:ParB/RepB/Spo0J family partition protein n=1 Tax=Macrococcus equipercicus TaxID=69967 RepID=A0A9Q9BMD6_9STAP|nr:ParB/RepB/Spo0J family partition protein [Macrococcus equipercicus]KAA1039506.1 ParB/RepB/Spo0J family partition protein [Macrococcus equipercicus]UTH13790.1 ParB/RepB/Spo0J family partition protein [Macrococcus equipercicus]